MRRTPLRPSRGTVWPKEESDAIWERDESCVGPRVGMQGDCHGYPERHHVRKGGMSMKSRSTRDNGVLLCGWAHHPWATAHGREARVMLLDYLAPFYADCPHVEPVHGCTGPCNRAVAS